MEARIKLAVLIDADNVSANASEALIQEIANYGVASVKRAYGDWTTTSLTAWKAVLHEFAIVPIQQFSYTQGKNSSDSAMIIDAMDLLYTEKFDGFCLVSSDSDFTKLATRIREAGLLAYGFGEKKTPLSLQAACDKFVFLEALKQSRSDNAVGQNEQVSTDDSTSQLAGQKISTADLRGDTKLVRLLRGAAEDTADDDGWSFVSKMATHIANQSSFDSRNYGYQKIGQLIEATELFDIEKRNQRKNGTYLMYVRDKRVPTEQ